MPVSLYTPSYSDHYKKYLGAFVDDRLISDTDNDLTRWVKSKPVSSTVYAAFGSTSLISLERMSNLINGLAEFLLKVPHSAVLLAFRSANYDHYQRVVKEMTDDAFQNVLRSEDRIKIEKGFVNQKWILQQQSVKFFISHCGMGSALEALYFEKPLLCMPFNVEQFCNAIAVDNRGVGLSLFVPMLTPWQALVSPYDFRNYTFSATSVTSKLSAIWMNHSYTQAARLMSVEMKHAGGLKRAIDEIEFFVSLNGSLDRFAPFQSTLPFYQRSMLDLFVAFVALPLTVFVYVVVKCRCRSRKEKTD